MQALPRLLVAAVALGAATTGAHADPPDRGYRFTAPKGLVYAETLSNQLARDLAKGHHYDGLPTEVGADAYVSEAGYAFYVLWVHATEPATDPALAVRRTFDKLRQAPVDDTSLVSSAEMVSWSERVENDLAVGDLEWRHLSNETVTRVRSSIYLTSGRLLRQVRGECVMQAAAVDRLRARCDEAFAALALTETSRGPLGAIPSAGELRLSDGADGDPMLLVVESGIDAGANDAPSLRPPTEGAVLYEQPARPAPEKDNTFLYLGGAILLIIGVYVLMRRPGDQDKESE